MTPFAEERGAYGAIYHDITAVEDWFIELTEDDGDVPFPALPWADIWLESRNEHAVHIVDNFITAHVRPNYIYEIGTLRNGVIELVHPNPPELVMHAAATILYGFASTFDTPKILEKTRRAVTYLSRNPNYQLLGGRA